MASGRPWSSQKDENAVAMRSVWKTDTGEKSSSALVLQFILNDQGKGFAGAQSAFAKAELKAKVAHIPLHKIR